MSVPLHSLSLPAASTNGDVWVIVRCYNEASVVGSVIQELTNHFPKIVGVDDGSLDDSGRAMSAAGATVVRHAVNLGAGAALQTGIEYALSDPHARFFICFDADGQHRVEDALAILERLRSEDADIVIGSRFLTDSASVPRLRRAVLKLARIFERVTSGASLTDAHNGLRGFTRGFAQTIELTFADMAYASEFVGLVARSGLRYIEQPVTINYTEYSLRKGQRSINSVNIALDVLMSRVFKGARR